MENLWNTRKRHWTWKFSTPCWFSCYFISSAHPSSRSINEFDHLHSLVFTKRCWGWISTSPIRFLADLVRVLVLWVANSPWGTNCAGLGLPVENTSSPEPRLCLHTGGARWLELWVSFALALQEEYLRWMLPGRCVAPVCCQLLWLFSQRCAGSIKTRSWWSSLWSSGKWGRVCVFCSAGPVGWGWSQAGIPALSVGLKGARWFTSALRSKALSTY